MHPTYPEAMPMPQSEKIKVSRVSAQDGPDSGEKHMERSPTSGEFIVRNVSLTHLLKVKEDQHLGVVEAIKEELSNVPVDPTNGFIQGQVLRLLQEHREDLEGELEAVTTAKVEEERRVCQLRVCSAQADGSGGEEQLQTVTVPLHKVRMEKEKWYDSMLAEYKSLTAETKAIRPVKRSEIDPEAELVPGKLCDQGWREIQMSRCDLRQLGITGSGSHAFLSAVCQWSGWGSDKVCIAKGSSSPMECSHDGH